MSRHCILRWLDKAPQSCFGWNSQGVAARGRYSLCRPCDAHGTKLFRVSRG